MIVLLFGQPCSGKTTLANELKKQLSGVLIDGDALRSIFQDTDFSMEGRKANIQRALNIAMYENSKEQFVFCSLVCPFNAQRVWLDGQTDVRWVYLEYDAQEQRGREGYHTNLFEKPDGLKHMLKLNTSENDVITCAGRIIDFLGVKQ